MGFATLPAEGRAHLNPSSFLCGTCSSPVPLDPSRAGDPVRCARCGRNYAWQEDILVLSDGAENGDYPAQVYEVLAEVEPRHFWFAERNRLILATMRRAIGPLAGRSALDVGCGTGFVLAALERAGMAASGLDMHLVGLRQARHRTNALLFCDRGARIPFAGQFDVVLLCDVIEHVDDDAALLRAASEALRPDGSLVITVPALPAIWTRVDDLSGHKRRYTRGSLSKTIRRAGLDVALIRYFNALLLPFQFVQRLLSGQRAVSSPGDELGVVRGALSVPPRPINAVLRLAMRADARLSRLPLPVGASLIAIARPR